MAEERPDPLIQQLIGEVVNTVADLAAVSSTHVEEVLPSGETKQVVKDSIIPDPSSEVRRLPFVRRLTESLSKERDLEMVEFLSPQIHVAQEINRLKGLLPAEEQPKLDWCVEQLTTPRSSSPERGYINYILKNFGSETATLLSDYSGEVKEALFQQDESTSRETIRRRSLQRTNSFVHLGLQLLPTLSIDDISSLSFDIFTYGELSGHKMTLSMISSLIFDQEGILTNLDIPTQVFAEFVKEIGKGYLNNPYHNALHAADVLQTSFLFCRLSNLIALADFDAIDTGALYLSSIIHDYKHPGYNNNFLERTSHKIAMRYNDSSCLENYHIAQAFKLATKDSFNIFQNMQPDVRRALRKYIIHCVLGTDMAKHHTHLTEASSKLENKAEYPQLKQVLLGLLIHAADVSNPTKPFQVYEKWAVRVADEFFLQGDKEKELNLPLTFMYDRASANLANMQVGFIKGVVLPYFSPLATAWPGFEVLISNLRNNQESWAKKAEEGRVE